MHDPTARHLLQEQRSRLGFVAGGQATHSSLEQGRCTLCMHSDEVVCAECWTADGSQVQSRVSYVLLHCVCVAQVNQATKLKAKAGRLQESAAELLNKAKVEKDTAASLKAT